MSKLKELFTSWRVLLVIAVLIMAVWAIQPRFSTEGVMIKSVDTNSSAEQNGVGTNIIINNLNGQKIADVANYNQMISNLKAGEIIKLDTNKGSYSFVAESQNGETTTGISIAEVPSSNLKTGLDLVGGVRVILKPAEKITDQQMTDVVSLVEKRLNVFGVSDIVVRQTKDLQGNQYVIVELAGANREEVAKLISQQGKFEAKIGDAVVFKGGEDIKSVCRSTDCSGIDPQKGCGTNDNGWACQFQFRVDISPESAQKHADITKNLAVISEGSNRYLEKKLDLYLDDKLVDSLYISESLKGQVATSFVIEGPGVGPSKEAAINSAISNMKNLQTLMITGSLPIKLDVAKMDIVSPTLGKNFFSTAILALLAAFVAVGAVVFIRYRKLKVALPIILTCVCEVLIILGFAAVIKWNLDLAAIAGIIAAVGTGTNDQIIIADEVLSGGSGSTYSWKEKLKNAFFIIFGAYATVVVAMAPLWAMGAGLLKGFALVTIVGVSVGVFITRPAYARIVEVLMK